MKLDSWLRELLGPQHDTWCDDSPDNAGDAQFFSGIEGLRDIPENDGNNEGDSNSWTIIEDNWSPLGLSYVAFKILLDSEGVLIGQ